jgi:hypothetical protein
MQAIVALKRSLIGRPGALRNSSLDPLLLVSSAVDPTHNSVSREHGDVFAPSANVLHTYL